MTRSRWSGRARTGRSGRWEGVRLLRFFRPLSPLRLRGAYGRIEGRRGRRSGRLPVRARATAVGSLGVIVTLNGAHPRWPGSRRGVPAHLARVWQHLRAAAGGGGLSKRHVQVMRAHPLGRLQRLLRKTRNSRSKAHAPRGRRRAPGPRPARFPRRPRGSRRGVPAHLARVWQHLPPHVGRVARLANVCFAKIDHPHGASRRSCETRSLRAPRRTRPRTTTRAPTTARSLPLAYAVSAAQRLKRRGLDRSRSRRYPGAAARSVASKSVLAIGPTHGAVAPAS